MCGTNYVYTDYVINLCQACVSSAMLNHNMSNQPEHQPDQNGWITSVHRKNHFSTHHLPCFKCVAAQQYSKCCDVMKNFVDLLAFIEKESGSCQRALQLIVDILILCQLERYICGYAGAIPWARLV